MQTSGNCFVSLSLHILVRRNSGGTVKNQALSKKPRARRTWPSVPVPPMRSDRATLSSSPSWLISTRRLATGRDTAVLPLHNEALLMTFRKCAQRHGDWNAAEKWSTEVMSIKASIGRIRNMLIEGQQNWAMETKRVDGG
jgi:hypothetical protein